MAEKALWLAVLGFSLELIDPYPPSTRIFGLVLIAASVAGAAVSRRRRGPAMREESDG